MAQPWIATMMPTVRRKRDFRPQPTYASEFWLLNTTASPLNDVRVRYALNMATDNRPIAELAGAGSIPARGVVPPTKGYPAPHALPVSIGGKVYDVLSFNPVAAREILATARHPLRLECVVPSPGDAPLWAQVLQAQWKANLGLDLVVITQEFPVWLQSVKARNFRHVAFWGSEGSYVDPSWFLDLSSSGDGYGSGWSDSEFNDMLSLAHATAHPALRMNKLAECERLLLQAMPILPLSHDVQPSLRKPFLKGLGSNLLNREQFKVRLDRHELEAPMMMCAPPSRRQLFLATAAGAAFSGACGRARRRPSGRLTYLLPTEPDTLDPAKSPGGSEVWLISALFEPLIQPHPETAAPIAGLATHYKMERGGTRYTFYLRGHPSPEGIRLPGTESLPAEYSRARAAAPYDVPARWSDGTPLTAHDIVYTWRRYLSPETGCPNAYTLYCVAGAEAISLGKIPPEELAVRAPDALTFQVDLHAPAPNFLLLCCSWNTFPLPRHAIEAARRRGREASWTEPGRMLASGPFVLKESRPRERIVIAKNPNYYDADAVGVEEIEFSAADGVTVLNLFEAGMADSMDGRVLPLQFVPRMRSKPEFHVRPACASHNWRISTKRPPLDNLLLRYALNMATDKEATTRFLGAGQPPARSRVPPLDGYRPAQSLLVEINGRPCDVLAYDPRVARELWEASASAEARLPLAIHYPARVDSRLLAEILQHQWRENLGVETKLMPHEPAAYIRTILTDGDYSGVAEEPYVAGYPDPYDLLSLYTANFVATWSDPAFDRMLTAATSIADPALRMQKLAECESTLLRAMPFVPLYFDTWVYLERPEVRGLSPGPMGYPAFKYAWIDSGGRLQ